MLLKDLRLSLRLLLKHPTFAVLAVVSLALGIGVNTGIFSIVDAVLLRDLPYEDPDRLVAIFETNEDLELDRGRIAAANFLDWREQSSSFESMAAYTPWTLELTVTGTGDPELVEAGLVTGNYFDLLGVEAFRGRTFVPEETWEGTGALVVLSHDFWQRRFAGHEDVLGRTLNLSGQDTTIIGVLPAGFRHVPREMDLWATFGWSPTGTQSSVRLRRTHNLHAVGLLAEGVSLEQAQADLDTIARRLQETYPETNHAMKVGIVPLRTWLVGDVRTPLLILLAAVTVVLVIGCINLANLLLARTSARRRELSLRTALGASRKGIVAQLMTESLMIALLGAVVGVVVCYWLIRFFVSLDQELIPSNFEVALDLRVLLYTLGISLLTALLFGLVPALRTSRTNPMGALKEAGTKDSSSLRDRLFRDLLIVSEVGLAVLLVVGAGLLLRSMDNLFEVDAGFETEGVLTFQLNLPGTRYDEDVDVASFYARLTERLEALPGVEAAGGSTLLPLTDQSWTGGFRIEGRSSDQDRQAVLRSAAVTPGFFEAVGVRKLAGRTLETGDDSAAARVVVVNQSLVDTYFASEDPLGKRISFDTDAETEDGLPWWTIVGVVGDLSQESLSTEPEPEVFRPHAQWVDDRMNLFVRTSRDPMAVVGDVRRAVRDLDPGLAVFGVQTLEHVVLESLGQKRFITSLMAVFALLALVQAALGIYGVISYSASLRLQEFGIRMALGARSSEVARLVLRHGMVVVGTGLALGLAASLFMTRFIEQQLYSVSRFDPLTFVGVVAFLTLIGLTASYLPARRATRVDPVQSLRSE